MNCKSSVIVTSSPTSTPPVSRAAFQASPKSLRLIFVVAESPMRVLPHGIFARCARPLDREGHLLGDAMQGQIASHGMFVLPDLLHQRGLEGHGWKFLGIEEVAALQVPIALGVARAERAYIDRGLNARIGE